MRFAYADPPYFGMGSKMYGKLHPEAAIWDDQKSHIDLMLKIHEEYPDGWAMSCNPSDLRWILPEAPEGVRVGSWVKTFHQIRPTSVQFAWEPVLWCGGRKMPKRKPMVRDWLSCQRAHGKGTPGAKPDLFNEWILDLLGFNPLEDTIDDLSPGSGGMQNAVQKLSLFHSNVGAT